MVKKAAYAIAGGRGDFFGIVNTWEQCRRRVHGISGAHYKGFFSERDARAWLDRYRAPSRDLPPRRAISLPVTRKERERVDLYVDGSCVIDSGAWAGVYHDAGRRVILKGVCAGKATNNRAEMQAIISSVSSIVARDPSDKRDIVCHTDSRYVLGGLAKHYSTNSDLWQQLRELLDSIKPRTIDFVKTPAHCGVELHDLADKRARDLARQLHRSRTLDYSRLGEQRPLLE